MQPSTIFIFFQHFIDLKKLLGHTTGSIYPDARKKSIMVQFSDEDPYGAIVAHTCAKQIVLPLNIFTNTEQSYQLFVAALIAVIENTTFNIV